MSINYADLTSEVRTCMLGELDDDLSRGSLYLSTRLTPLGVTAWHRLLRAALEGHDDGWLAKQLSSAGYLLAHESRRTAHGTTMVRVPHTAPMTLAEGEFNRFYARGLSRWAVASGEVILQVYRGKTVDQTRRESEAMIGRTIDAAALLRDLRSSVGVEPALGLPPGPNSGLSVRRVRRLV